MKHERRSEREKLWVVSTSRHYSMDEIWVLAKCALESVARDLKPGKVMPNIKVKFTNSEHAYCGRAYWTEWQRSPGKMVEWKRILVRVGPPKRFVKPINATYPKFKDMPEYVINGSREAIVHIIAHEAEHALGTPGGKAGEEVCELVSWDAVEWYRKHQSEVDGKIAKAKEHDNAVAERQMLRQTPEAKTAKALADAEKKLAQWKRKRKLAETKVKHYERTVKRLHRHTAASVPRREEGHADLPPGLPESVQAQPRVTGTDCHDGVDCQNHSALAASPPA